MHKKCPPGPLRARGHSQRTPRRGLTRTQRRTELASLSHSRAACPSMAFAMQSAALGCSYHRLRGSEQRRRRRFPAVTCSVVSPPETGRQAGTPSSSGKEDETVRYSLFGLSSAEYKEQTRIPRPRTLYNEQPFDRLALGYLCGQLANAVGEKLPPGLANYDTFTELARKISLGRDAEAQRSLVLGLLVKAIPSGVLFVLRRLVIPGLMRVGFPVYEGMAWGARRARRTGPFAGWLVGPSTQEQMDLDGQMRWSRVKVKRCRYLEASGCKSQCINICKVPTQRFFAQEMGVPLYMKPDFDDLSCELCFGQAPPPLEEDPAFTQSCFATCAVASAGGPPKSRTGPPACQTPAAPTPNAV